VTGQEDMQAGTPSTDPLSKQARLTIWVRGRVQGVGFRWWVRSNALALGLMGMA
jgi:acylphosphatase